MFAQTVLIAETDPRILGHLPQVLSDAIPQVNIDICTSEDGLARKLRHTSYNTLALSPLLFQEYRLAKQKQPLQLLAPLLVTASPEHRPLAQVALETDAFDMIVSPLVPAEAIHTVRLALWQNRLLQLLTTKEQAVSRFHAHMETFPHARQAEEQFVSKLAAFDRTYQALQSSMRLLLNVEGERAFFDIAALVEESTKQRALDRLLTLNQRGLM